MQLLGKCLATIAYAQLIAENAQHLTAPEALVSEIFGLLVADFSTDALNLAAFPQLAARDRTHLRRIVTVPETSTADANAVSAMLTRGMPEGARSSADGD